ncbi:hypothetical protein Y032_0002g1079 [Ancylostoma ceylanicum]|nr:hypothetical protein Y032_0002g1079 [Ancylostoma ceylanicum]
MSMNRDDKVQIECGYVLHNDLLGHIMTRPALHPLHPLTPMVPIYLRRTNGLFGCHGRAKTINIFDSSNNERMKEKAHSGEW